MWKCINLKYTFETYIYIYKCIPLWKCFKGELFPIQHLWRSCEKFRSYSGGMCVSVVDYVFFFFHFHNQQKIIFFSFHTWGFTVYTVTSAPNNRFWLNCFFIYTMAFSKINSNNNKIGVQVCASANVFYFIFFVSFHKFVVLLLSLISFARSFYIFLRFFF